MSIRALGMHYRVGGYELGLLGVLDDRSIAIISNALIDTLGLLGPSPEERKKKGV